MKGLWYLSTETLLFNSVKYMLLDDERRYTVYDPMTAPDDDREDDQPHLPFEPPDPTADRPDRCECWGQSDLPCFCCFLAGFDDPNPDAPDWTPRPGDE